MIQARISTVPGDQIIPAAILRPSPSGIGRGEAEKIGCIIHLDTGTRLLPPSNSRNHGAFSVTPLCADLHPHSFDRTVLQQRQVGRLSHRLGVQRLFRSKAARGATIGRTRRLGDLVNALAAHFPPARATNEFWTNPRYHTTLRVEPYVWFRRPASTGGFHLLNAEATGCSPLRGYHLVKVGLVRSSVALALTSCYIID